MDLGLAMAQEARLPADNGDATSRHQSQGNSRKLSQRERPVREMISNVAEPTAAPAFPALSQQLEKDLVQVFKLLSDETRLRILMYLAREHELHVSALCDRLGQSQPA